MTCWNCSILGEACHLETGVHPIGRLVQVSDRPHNTAGYDDHVATAKSIKSPEHKLSTRLLIVGEQVIRVTYSH